MPEGQVCRLCGHVMTLRRCGYGMADGAPLCHADDHDCYRLWMVYKVYCLPPEDSGGSSF
jgi:hypothetical protein